MTDINAAQSSEYNQSRLFLVPLDGSHAAESVLGLVEILAAGLPARVLLLHAIERKAQPRIHQERHLTTKEEALLYLNEIAEGLEKAKISVNVHVHENGVSDVGESILEHAAETNPDLVIMCTHGSGGLHGFLFGRIAQQVLKNGRWPVLMIPSNAAVSSRFDNILFPLDALHEHQMAMAFILPFIQAFNAALHLVAVVPTTDSVSGRETLSRRLMPSATRAMLDLAAQGTSKYLQNMSEDLLRQNIVTTTTVLRGDVVEKLIERASEISPDLIVISGHAKAGIDALIEGSIGQQLVEKSRAPLLLLKIDR